MVRHLVEGKYPESTKPGALSPNPTAYAGVPKVVNAVVLPNVGTLQVAHQSLEGVSHVFLTSSDMHNTTVCLETLLHPRQ